MNKIAFFLLFSLLLCNLCYAQEADFSDSDDDGYDDNTGLDKNGYAGPDKPIPTKATKFKLKPGIYNTEEGKKITVYGNTEIERNTDGTLKIGGNNIGGNNIKYSDGRYSIIGEGSVNGVALSNAREIESDKENGVLYGIADKDCNVNGIWFLKGSHFLYSSKKKYMVLLGSAEITSIDDNYDGSIISTDKSKELPNGVMIKGILRYKNGQPYINPGETLEIDGVEIKSREKNYDSEKRTPLFIFFDGEKHPKTKDDYISINAENKKLILSCKLHRPAELKFKENNPFIKIKRDNEVNLINLENMEFSIENRDNQGLIPEAIFSEIDSKKGSSFSLYNRGARIHKIEFNSDIYLEIEGDLSPGLSSAMSIKFNDDKGNSLIGTKENPQKILVSSYNEVVFAPDASKNKNAKIVKSRTIKITQDYQEEKVFNAHFDSDNNLIGYSTDDEPNRLIDVNGNKIGRINGNEVEYDVVALEGWTETSYKYNFAPGKVSERLYFNNMPPEVFEGDDIVLGGYTMGGELFNLVKEEDRIIVYYDYDSATLKKISDGLKRMPPKMKESIGAIRVNSQGGVESGSIAVGYTEGGKLMHLNKYNFGEGTLLHEGSHTLTMQLGGEDGKDSTFYKNWISVAGDVYDSGENYGKVVTIFGDFEDAKKRGCFTPYGCSHPYGWEDMSTYSQSVYTNPSKYNEFVEPKNEDKRPIKKMSLLNEYGFLPDGFLSNKMKETGYSQDCIDAVTSKDGFKAGCINKK